MERWRGRVVIVTGASSGIGEAIARLLANKGMRVVGVARRVERVKALAAEVAKIKGELHAIQGDVTKEEDVVRIVKWTRDNLGGADVLVNNAGVLYQCPLTDADVVKMQSMLDLNILGLCMLTRDVIKDMRTRGVDDGHIIHINGVAGHQMINFPGAHFYTATKHAVRVLTEGLRRELRDLGTKIRISELSPGAVRTEIAQVSGMTAEQVEERYASMPYLNPRDVAEALIYALGAPPHVQVHEIIIFPISQPTTNE